jgi:NitT/TauT family transport system substrate-binding protein
VKPARRPSRVALLAGLIVTALVVVGCAGASPGRNPGEPLVLATGSTRLSTAVVQYMAATGADRNEGLALDYAVTSTATSSALMAGLLSGEYDFVATGTPTAIDAVSKGAAVKVVASICRTPDTLVIRTDVMHRLPVGPDAPVRDRIQALKSLRIGTAPVGTSTHDRVRAVARSGGLDPDQDITLLGSADGAAMAAGLRSGLYDAVWVAVGDTEPLIAEGLAARWLSYPNGDFDDFTEKALVVLARSDAVETDPDAVRRLRAALQTSADRIRSDPASAGAVLKKSNFAAMDQEAFDIAWESGGGLAPESVDFTREDLDRSRQMAELAGGQPIKIDYDTLVAEIARGNT